MLDVASRYLHLDDVTAPVYRAIDGDPIVWTDPDGVTHLCEAADAGPNGERLVWTMCSRDGRPGSRDVPPNAARTADDGDRVTCLRCLAHGPLKPPVR